MPNAILCRLPVERGHGSGVLHRWAYNSLRKTCETFVYRGKGGNFNNFLTRADCLDTCGPSTNPCGSDAKSSLPRGRLTKCSKFNSITCSDGFYCHFGGTPETNVCCPKSGVSPCLLPLETGSGSTVLHRYYFDSASSTCRAFTYTGLGGNENNFLTVQDCRKICPEFDNPCPRGSPFVNPSDGSAAFCTATNPTCPKKYFCHIGHSRQTTVCCPAVGHPCASPVVLGIGSSQLPRYYYNTKTRSCVAFMYSGKGGNSNNFMSKTECETTCPVLDNPCVSGFPALDEGGEPVFCSTSNSDSCPSGFWCHIGNTQATTLCCPAAGDPCRLPMSRGIGATVLNRWYFNSESKVCVSFVYTGRGGNENNFMSRRDCLARCPEFKSPCPEGALPHIGLSGQITHCGATEPSICPTTYWCHIGGSLDSSVCCPNAADPCDQVKTEGTGSMQLLRFYYNQLSRTCDQFIYTGIGGNENNFQTRSSCESRCPIFVNPCSTGPPELDESMNPITCTAMDDSTCSDGHWCHVGATEQSTICCSYAVKDPCAEPRVVGSGSSSLPRWYYNPLTKQCLSFIYTGLGGNQNNFFSRAACEKACPVLQNPCVLGEPATGSNGFYVTCSSSSPHVCPAGYWCHIGEEVTDAVCCPGAENPCSLPASEGSGQGSLARWYFDTNMRRCSRFIYTGSGGNQNNFFTMQDCQLKCPEFQNPCLTGDPAQAPGGGILFCSATRKTCPASYWCHIGATADLTVCCPNAGDPCLSSMQSGSGTAKLTRWYFNQNTRQCLQFTYTGSEGNANNFLSEQACAEQCPVFRNPCPSGGKNSLLAVTKCSAQNPQSCPSGYWCHIGGSPDSSVCCPGASDPCRLPFNQGGMLVDPDDDGPYTRWYYDLSTKTCRAFQYTGFGGNENNFLTKEDCAQRCPEFVNPCFLGDPLTDSLTGMVRYCTNHACPTNYFCHLGSSTETTVCCPSSQDPCTQPLAPGTGSDALVRWYYNAQAKQCQEYIYTGMGGNSNNFVSKSACAQTCSEFTNPCGDGQPLMTLGGDVTYCSSTNKFICPTGYYCHLGATSETTVCCPGPTNACLLPRDIGRGSTILTRYFYNQVTHDCQEFVYTGIAGNANNYLSRESCFLACQKDVNPCGEAISGPLQHCSVDSPCPDSYYCHFGVSDDTTVCCPASSSGNNICQLPSVVGTGQTPVTRYFYNAGLAKCVPFVYSGIGGNQNNFLSSSDCRANCDIHRSQIPSSTMSKNPCNDEECTSTEIERSFSRRLSIRRHPPDHRPKAGEKLCSQGEPLTSIDGVPVICNVDDAESCSFGDKYTCMESAATGRAYCCPNPKHLCLLPRLIGNPCSPETTVRFAYDPSTDSCQVFHFNGCGGNLNNFVSHIECSFVCSNKGYNLLASFADDDYDGSTDYVPPPVGQVSRDGNENADPWNQGSTSRSTGQSNRRNNIP